MTRDSIVFSVKHKLQQCHNGNNALYSTLASLWWSKTYFYPMSMSLVSDITILWLWPHLGLTRTSPVSTKLVDQQRKSIWKCPGEITARKSTSLLACFLNILMARLFLRATSTAVLSSILLHCHNYIRKPSKTFGYVCGRHQNSCSQQYVLVDF